MFMHLIWRCVGSGSVLVATASSALAAGGPFLEFLDDFGKPARLQRNPYEERIETERHDFTQSAVTVGRGVVQLESGYSFFYNDNDGEQESSHTFPETLLRVGLSEDIEMRLRWNHAWKFIEEEEDRTGAEELRYSVKLQMTRQCRCGWVPTSALELRGSAPTGGDPFSTGNAEFSFDYIYQWEIGEGSTFGGSSGFGTNGFGDFGFVGEDPGSDPFNFYTQSFVFGRELGERNTCYLEWFGVFSDGLADEWTASVLNVGIDHYLSDDFVVDFRIGIGLTEDSDDFFTGIGGGYRF